MSFPFRSRLSSGPSLPGAPPGRALGVGRGAAFVIGDSAVWAEPQEDVAKLVPNYPLLWSMIGIARPPGARAVVRKAGEPGLAAWQYTVQGDTVEFVRRGYPAGQLIAEVRQAGRMIGRVVTDFDADGRLWKSRLTVPSGPARLDITFLSTTEADEFEPEIWTLPPP